MAIDPVNNRNTIPPNGMGVQEFLRVLLSQLIYQDPLKPMDNQEFMAHIAQLTSLEQSLQMNERLGQFLENQAVLQSSSMLGRTVDVESAGTSLTGVVKSVSLAEQGMRLTVQDDSAATVKVGLDQVKTIR